MTERKYLPTLADLIDRLSIVLLKEINIPEHKSEYRKEREDILSDIEMMEEHGMTSDQFFASLVVMLANKTIWDNETRARQGGSEQDKLLKFTHSINGVRSRAKNIISSGDRVDHKVDCLAADLPPEFGNWRIFD